MALPDLTGQNIQDTYQRVLQVSGSGLIADGTGSLFTPLNATSASYASYAVSASHEIIKEISSSYAETASYVQQAVDNATNITLLTNVTGSYATTGSNTFIGNQTITGSLIVSGSGQIITGSLSIHSIGTPGLRVTSNNDPAEEVKIYDGKIAIEDSGYDVAVLSSNIVDSRLGVLELGNWSSATNGVYLQGYGVQNYANWIGGALIVGRTYTPSSFKHHVALDVTGSAVITGSLSVIGTSRTIFTTASLVYSGSNVTQVTQSYETGETQITNILYSGSFADGNPLSIAVTGSDGINKLYTLTYSASLVTQIIQS